jgi:hypothetical protein
MQAMTIVGSSQRRLLAGSGAPRQPRTRSHAEPIRTPALVAFACAVGLLVALLPGMASAPVPSGAGPAPISAPAPVAPAPMAPVR